MWPMTAPISSSVSSSPQAGMTGQLDTQSVVEATVALEATVKVAVSMRDKFVEAYKEVLRMPI